MATTEETKKEFEAACDRFCDDNPNVAENHIGSLFVFSIQHDDELMGYLVGLIGDHIAFHELFGIDAELRGR